MPQVKPEVETFAKIKVIGIGGSGGSAIDRMVKAGIRGVDFTAVNTDVQALHYNSAPHKLHIGKSVTRGLGAGMDPELGRKSAEESQNEIREIIKDADMVFLTCGLGGGTGSGASPIVAAIARELGVLTIAVVTKPFTFEGQQRKAIAERAHEELARNIDTIITIPNDQVLQIIDKKTSLLDAFKIVDDVLRQGVQGISELITVPGLINVDFADVKAIMRDTGSALMGIGVGSGENRAVEAAKAAISSPLLEISIDGARGILFTITGGMNLGMHEVEEAAKVITSSADENAKVIFGAIIDEALKDEIRITVVATGFEERGNKFSSGLREEDTRSFFGNDRNFYSSANFLKKDREKEEPSRSFDRSSSNLSHRVENKAVNQIEPQVQGNPSVYAQDKEEPAKRSIFVSKPVMDGKEVDTKKSVMRPLMAKTKNDAKDDEDLEIPAFIRRKMGL